VKTKCAQKTRVDLVMVYEPSALLGVSIAGLEVDGLLHCDDDEHNDRMALDVICNSMPLEMVSTLVVKPV
jgi:hypothetical protein